MNGIISTAFANVLDAFAESIRRSTEEGGPFRVRGIMALAVTGAAIWLAIDGVIGPEVFVAAWTGILGVYFGSRMTQVATDRANGKKNE